MAMIQCKYCGKDVSDKAHTCPHCGETLMGIIPEADSDKETVLCCEECGSELPKDVTTCPNCGCPVPAKAEEATQKVEVTAVKLKVKQSTKKYAMIAVIAVIAVIAIAVIGVIASNIHKSNLAREAAELSAEYASNIELVSYTMLTGAAKAEDAGNLIKKVWYNAIYEERDSETDKYTRPKGYFVSDFNEALSTLFSDTDFQSSISNIEDNQDTVASLMKQLKNPPEEHEEAYGALKEFYHRSTDFPP